MPRGLGSRHSPGGAKVGNAARALLASLAVLGAGAGCRELLGEYRTLVLDAGPTTPPPPDGPPDLCVEGEYRCRGAALQACKDDRQGYRTVRLCASAALCDDSEQAPQCRLPTCLPGSHECVQVPVDGGQDQVTELRACSDGGEAWIAVAGCLSEAHCNATLGRCTDQPCSDGDVRCNGDERQVCDDGDGWALRFSCEGEPALCDPDPAAGGCRAPGCEEAPGGQQVPFRCSDADFLRCREDQSGFELVETCINAAHCNAFVADPRYRETTRVGLMPPEDLRALGCSEPDCTPGHWACDGAELSFCDANRTRYRPVETCATAGHCDAREGRCRDQPCVEGATQCSGKEWQQCVGGLWQTTATCTRASLCVHADGCLAATCRVTEYHCEGATLERCNVGGNGWIPVQTCETAALCDPHAKRCNPAVCEGGFSCGPDGSLRRCAEGRHEWEIVADCGSLAGPDVPDAFASGLCDLPGQTCLPEPQCAEDTFRCNGSRLERCRPARAAVADGLREANVWVPYARCATAALCDPAGSCAPPACEAGEARCVTPGAEPIVAGPDDPTRGLTLEVCNAGRTGFETAQTCSPDELCDAAHRQCDLCEPRARLCLDDATFTCSSDGQERERERSCPAGCGLVDGVIDCL